MIINFIWRLIKIGIGVLLILGLSYILRILALIYKSSKKVVSESICDTCEHLNKKGGDLYKYRCDMSYGGFDKPPQICRYYQKKSGD